MLPAGHWWSLFSLWLWSEGGLHFVAFFLFSALRPFSNTMSLAGWRAGWALWPLALGVPTCSPFTPLPSCLTHHTRLISVQQTGRCLANQGHGNSLSVESLVQICHLGPKYTKYVYGWLLFYLAVAVIAVMKIHI